MTYKKCIKCLKTLHISKFYSRRNECKECKNKAHKKYMKDYRKDNNKLKEYHRNYRREVTKKKLGVETHKEFCEICGRKELHRELSLDHDHKTGKFRGYLCSKCNTMLGYAEDNPLILIKAVHYLKGDSN